MGKPKRRPPLSLPAEPDSEWLRKGAVANFFNVSKRTIDRAVKKKLLAAPDYPLGPDLYQSSD